MDTTGPTTRSALDARITERDFQAHVLEMVRAFGWRAYHSWSSVNSQRGFPDLVLVRERVIFAELKREDGRTTLEQAAWLADLEAADAEVHVWRPGDREEIAHVLARR